MIMTDPIKTESNTNIYRVLILSVTLLLLFTGIQSTGTDPNILPNPAVLSIGDEMVNIPLQDLEKQLNTFTFWKALGNRSLVGVNNENEIEMTLQFLVGDWKCAKKVYTPTSFDYSIKYKKIELSMFTKDKNNDGHTYTEILEVLKVISRLNIDSLVVAMSSSGHYSPRYGLCCGVPAYYNNVLSLFITDKPTVNIRSFTLTYLTANLIHAVTSVLIPTGSNAELVIEWGEEFYSLMPINPEFLRHIDTLTIYYKYSFTIDWSIIYNLPDLQQFMVRTYQDNTDLSLTHKVASRAYAVSVPMNELLSDNSVTSYLQDKSCPLNIGNTLISSLSLKQFLKLKLFKNSNIWNCLVQDDVQVASSISSFLNDIKVSDVVEKVFLVNACSTTLRLVDVLRVYASGSFTEEMLNAIQADKNLNILFKDALTNLRVSQVDIAIKKGKVYFELGLNSAVSEALFNILNQKPKHLKRVSIAHYELSSFLQQIQRYSPYFTIDKLSILDLQDTKSIDKLSKAVAALKDENVDNLYNSLSTLNLSELWVNIRFVSETPSKAPSMEYWISKTLKYLIHQSAIVKFSMTRLGLYIREMDKQRYIHDNKVSEWNLPTEKIESLSSIMSFNFWVLKNDNFYHRCPEYSDISFRLFRNTFEDIQKIVPVVPIHLYAALIDGIVENKMLSPYNKMPFLFGDYIGASHEVFTCPNCHSSADLRVYRTKPKTMDATTVNFDPTFKNIVIMPCNHPLCFKCAYSIIMEQEQEKRKCPTCTSKSSTLVNAHSSAPEEIPNDLVLGMLVELYDATYVIDVGSNKFEKEIKQHARTIPYWLICPDRTMRESLLLTASSARSAIMRTVVVPMRNRFSNANHDEPSTSKHKFE